MSKTAELEVQQKLGVLEEDLDEAADFEKDEKPIGGTRVCEVHG